MKYLADSNFIYLINPPFHKKDEIKERLSGVWTDSKERGKGWRFPRNLFVYRELYMNFKELKEDEMFMDHYKLSATMLKHWSDMKNIDLSQVPSAYSHGLRSYQNEDVSYLVERGSAVVFNEPRTGKTPTMIAVMKALNTKINLVVCPASLVLNWKKEIEAWYPEATTYAVTGTPNKQYNIWKGFESSNKHRFFIVSKDTLKKKMIWFKDFKFDTMIVDEAHFLRNHKSKQSEAIFSIHSNIKYALTGTPAVKHGSDVYGILHFIKPDAFPSFWQFTDRYWEIKDNGWGKDLGEAKKSREKELRELMNIYGVQRKRKDIMKWLPAATHQTIPVMMSGKQEKLYEQMFETFMATDSEVEVDTMNKLTQLMRLRQLCLDPRLLGFKEVGAKTDALLEFAEDYLEPLVVMTTFSSYFDLIKPDLEKLGKKVGVIDGSVSKQNRNKLVQRFQDGKIDILLCNIIAAGTGLTLDRADTILFLDKDFSPANNEQAQDRIVPTTEERYHPINILSLVVAGTVDERVNEILDRKEDLTKLINRPEVFA